MILHGKVHDGVVVLDDGKHLPEGARVAVIPEGQATNEPQVSAAAEPEERARIREILDRIAALPIEGDTDSFSGADHDRALYGSP